MQLLAEIKLSRDGLGAAGSAAKHWASHEYAQRMSSPCLPLSRILACAPQRTRLQRALSARAEHEAVTA